MTRVASLSERLRGDCGHIWDGLHKHPFVRELAAGTLAPEKFRFYIEQNLQYLPEYARAMAIGASKAAELETMRIFVDELANVLESEIPENAELLRRVLELGAADRGGSVCMAPANVAYTSFLVSVAARGGPPEILAAIVPCTWSYGDIAASLVDSGEVAEHPVYAEWVRFFGKPRYGEIVAKMRSDLERVADGLDEAGTAKLSGIFTMSTRLERAFWDMAYNLEQWPDVSSG